MTTDSVHSFFFVDFSLCSVYFFNIFFWYRYCLNSCLELFYKICFLKCLQNSLENNSAAIFFFQTPAQEGVREYYEFFKNNFFEKNTCKGLLLTLECYSMISGAQYYYLICSRYFHAISPNYTNEENLQTRFNCHIFLKIHALVSDRH